MNKETSAEIAKRVFAIYSTTLGCTKRPISSERRLPYRKEVIKSALQRLILAEGEMNVETAALVNAYMELARFQPLSETEEWAMREHQPMSLKAHEVGTIQGLMRAFGRTRRAMGVNQRLDEAYRAEKELLRSEVLALLNTFSGTWN